MLHPLRSRGFALATLAAFLLAQPAALCNALCLFERHHPAHTMPQMARGALALAGSACHSTTAGTVQHDPFNVLSPMAPTRGPVITVAPPRPVEPARMRPASPREVFHTVESPPPRFA